MSRLGCRIQSSLHCRKPISMLQYLPIIQQGIGPLLLLRASTVLTSQPYQPAQHRTQHSMSPRIPLLFFFLALACTQSCFWPDGSERDSSTKGNYRPCSNDTSDPLSHICCAVWDTCLPNGLCYNGVYWRESCTLKNWEAGGCQDLCTSAVSQEPAY